MKDRARADLAARLLADPRQVVELLLPFRSHGWGLDTGLPTPDILGEHDYEALTKLVDPHVLLSALQQVYGEVGSDAEDRRRVVATEEGALAQQFVYQHRRAMEIRARQTDAADEESRRSRVKCRRAKVVRPNMSE